MKKPPVYKPSLGERFRRQLRGMISLEGSLSLMLPPGIEHPGLAGDTLLNALAEHERR